MISNAPARGVTTPVAGLETDEQSAQRIAALLAESFAAEAVAVSLVDAGHGRWRVAIHFRAAPDEKSVAALVMAAAGPAAAQSLSFDRVAAKDWVSESLAGLKPVQAGRFIVHGAHDRASIAANRIGIEIEAALAFGTGHHGTTRGCLLALDRMCKSLGKRRVGAANKRAPRILDLGTGSGVLAIAVARALRQPVLATDIEATAVRAARANARLNRVGTMVEVAKADSVAGRRLCARAPFGLVVANILLGPVKRFAAPLTRLVAPGSRVVLSGLLPSQANAALAAYRALALERRIDLDGWTTLVLTRRLRRHPAVARRRRDP
jgi:ribosomal protein L11 methyltransferase